MILFVILGITFTGYLIIIPYQVNSIGIVIIIRITGIGNGWIIILIKIRVGIRRLGTNIGLVATAIIAVSPGGSLAIATAPSAAVPTAPTRGGRLRPHVFDVVSGGTEQTARNGDPVGARLRLFFFFFK